MRRLIFPLLLLIVGCGILLSLGTWQVQRLDWKRGVLAEIEARIAADPVAVPEAPTEAEDEYLPVTVTGALGGTEVLVFTPVEGLGIGFRVLSVLMAGDRALLVDLGFVPQEAGAPGAMAEQVTITGNLLWPDELTGSTPPPDPRTGVWYARDAAGISDLLGTEPFIIVTRSVEGADLTPVPVPVGTAGIRNNHLEYAITWYLLAAVWAVMSLYLMWRVARRKE